MKTFEIGVQITAGLRLFSAHLPKPPDINTSLIERLNLTLRQENAALSRKTLAFAKDEDKSIPPVELVA